jgi:ubiquinone/menaquinone biosynthesis C-methylase UbiE
MGRIAGPTALEVGVGTGKNLIFYPDDLDITAIDLSARMLGRARKRANKLNLTANLQEMDVEHLNFADDGCKYKSQNNKHYSSCRVANSGRRTLIF